MGIQRRASTFSFMGVDAMRRSVDVIPEAEDHAALIRRRRPELESINGTVALTNDDFLSGRKGNPPMIRLSLH